MNFIRDEESIFGTGSFFNYKFNNRELQETGMYDYGARFLMPDIGRWGVLDQRSQYTHEAYSYVWNNPIFFNDPTGMTGEAFADWIYNPTTDRYRWDPNVTGEDNTPKDWDYVGKTGSYRIEGATVQLLEGGKTFTDIDEVTVTGVSPAAASITLSRNSQFGLFAFFAVAAWYISSDIVGSIYEPESVRIDPAMYRHTDNAESSAESNAGTNAETDTTDVNGVNVPQEGKSSKNEKHGDGGRAESKAEQQIKDLEKQKEGAPKKERQKIDQKIKNIRENAQKSRKGEEHSRANKR